MTWAAVDAARQHDPWNQSSRCRPDEVTLHKLATHSVKSNPCPSQLQIPRGNWSRLAHNLETAIAEVDLCRVISHDQRHVDGAHEPDQ